MPRVPILRTAIFCICLALPCASRNLVRFIRLSPDEVTKAKQLAQSLRDAEERNKKAKIAWEQFEQSYQAVHPDLHGIEFTDDFRLAVSRVGSPALGLLQVASIELTAEERKKLESLRQEMTESEQSLRQARIAWQDFQIQFMADHSGSCATATTYSEATLSSGERVRICPPWMQGVAFTTDFKLAFPLGDFLKCLFEGRSGTDTYFDDSDSDGCGTPRSP